MVKNDFKYFIGHKYAKTRPLCMLLQKLISFRRDLDKTKYLYFLIKDEKLLEKYNEKKVSNIIKKEFHSKLVHDKQYLKTKKSLIVEKSTQGFPIIEYQRKALYGFFLSESFIDSIFGKI